MTQISDQDWELLNALADGELPEPDASRLRERIEQDPLLAEALVSVCHVSSALSVLKPEVTEIPAVQNINRRPWVWGAAGAVAAALGLVVFLNMAEPKYDPADIHARYAAQSFDLSEASELRFMSGGRVEGFPDLSEANLTLVETSMERSVSSAHYVGRNGCRLTVLRGADASTRLVSGMQSAKWTVGDGWYQVIATRMDQGKFDAVTVYLQQATREALEDKTVLALQGAVSTAAPCA